MEIVYYYDTELNSCPVRVYLEEYKKGGKKISAQRGQKIFANIDAKIERIQENQGRPILPFSKSLKFYNFFEIKNPKDAKTVIRILYFCHQEKIVLLHAFEKPAIYTTKKDKKQVDREYKIGEKYLNNFKKYPQNYEKYQKYYEEYS